MDIKTATEAFAALSQSTRLNAFRLLMQAGPDGMSAGKISEVLGVRQNTMSANLSGLLGAGLVRNQRDGRSIRYFVDVDGVQAVLGYLLEDCCGGRQELSRPVLDQIAKQMQPSDTNADPPDAK